MFLIILFPSHVSKITVSSGLTFFRISLFNAIFPKPCSALRIYVGIAKPEVFPRNCSYIRIPSAIDMEKCLVPMTSLG